MPAWKWGPDNAALKIAVNATTIPVTAQVLMRQQTGAAVATIVLFGPVPILSSFSILRDLIDKSQVVCKLIRAGGIPDLELPINSFQAFVNNNSGGNIQVTIPDYSYAEAIADRSTGSLAIYKKRVGAGDIRYLEEIAILPITSIRDDVGARNQSITLEAREDG